MANRFEQFAAPGVRRLAPYVPGKPPEQLERELGITGSIKLASNENPLGPGPQARAALAAAIAGVGMYPDGSGHVLRSRLAAKHRFPIGQVTLGNGSNDVLVLLAETFLTPEHEAVYSQYAFAVYPIAVQASGAKARRRAGESAGSPRCRSVTIRPRSSLPSVPRPASCSWRTPTIRPAPG